MVVLSSKMNSSGELMSDAKEHHESCVEMFRKELDAYCAYNEWLEKTEDRILIMALDEIMYDEYLHAKFLRDYMIDKGTYTLTDDDPHEKKFWKIHKKLFQK